MALPVVFAERPDGPVTSVGVHTPDGLPEGSEVYTMDRITGLLPG
ncbi:hypothetical protein [Actinoplanes sp. G11-F43]